MQSATALASRAAARGTTRSGLEILSGLLLDAGDHGLRIVGYDYDLGIEVCVPVTIGEAGTVVVPARQLTSIVKSLPRTEVVLAAEEAMLRITADKTKFKLQQMEATSYPALPEDSGQTLEVPFEEFREMVRKVAFATANADKTGRYVLSGVYTVFEQDELTMVATDSFRMAVRTIPASFPVDEPVTAIVPAQFLEELARATGGEDIRLTIGTSHIHSVVANMRFTGRLLEGQFPAWQQVLPHPADAPTRLTADREQLLAAVERVSLMCKDDMAAIRLKQTDNTLSLKAVYSEVGEAHEEIGIGCDKGGDMWVALRPTYLRDALSAMGGDEVNIYYQSHKHPVLLRDPKDPNYSCVVMPISTPVAT